MGKLEQVEQEISKLQKERTNLLRQTVAKCSHCGKGTTIAKLTFIQTKWYVPPRGCSEGDYWEDDEGQWQCPHCEHIVRLIDPNPQAKLLVERKHYFKDIKVKHKD